VIVVTHGRQYRLNIFMAPEHIPICPEHGCDMRAYKSKRLITYFACPKTGCECTDRSVRKLFTVDRTSAGTSASA
jgi:hypothetical protein